MKLIENSGDEFVVTEDPIRFLEIYLWLTTIEVKDIKETSGDNFVSGLSNNVANVSFDIPNSPKQVVPGKWWKSYAWVWKTLIQDDLKVGLYFDYIHFQMNSPDEYKLPPIPLHLYQFYLTYKDLVNFPEVT